MPTFNATLLFVFLSFFIFMLLMKQVFFDPILKIKAERERRLTEDKESTLSFQSQYEKLSAEYAERLKKARQESHHLIQAVRQESKLKAQQSLLQARTDAQQQMQQKLAEMSDWREKTYQQLESERNNLAQAIIQKIQAGGKIQTASGRSS